jgi:xanthine dehydrogenase FAD-binding subunit
VLEEVQPRSSWRASKEFRLQLIAELARRALREAMLSSLGNSLLDQTSAG